MPIDPTVLQEGTLIAYLLVFMGGILTSIAPCNVAMIPLIIGYVSGSQQLSRQRCFVLSLTFAIGLAITFMLLGIFATLIGGVFGGTSRVWFYIVAGVCVLIGLNMLGLIPLPELHWLSDLRSRIALKGIGGALALGLVSGLVASQCATPVIAAILTYVMAAQNTMVYGATLMFVYALGRGVPIVAAGTFTGALKSLRSFGAWSGHLQRASGILIIGVGMYFLWVA